MSDATISSTTFPRDIGEYVSKAVSGETIHITNHGRPQVVIVSAREYAALCEARRQLAWTRMGDTGSQGPLA